MTSSEMFSGAQWVQAGDKCLNPCIRGSFYTDDINKAQITICGLGFFELYINGKRVSDELFVPVNSHFHHYDDCHCFKDHGEELAFRIYCVRYDISEYLVSGKNAVAVILGQGWYQPYGECKLCYKIETDEKTILSDEKLRWREGPVIEYSLTKGEKQDYLKNNYNDGWMLADYDDAQWDYVTAVNPPESNYYIQGCPADKIIRTIKPVIIKETADYRVYDMGENITGWPIIACETKGQEVVVRVSEEKNEDNTISEQWQQDQSFCFVTDGESREYHPEFCWFGFRYAQVPRIAEMGRCDVIHADIPVTSSFTSDNRVLNWFYEAYIRTQLCNMHAGIPSDCPHLEKRGYTGDGQLTCETAMLLFDDRDFYLKWMEDISDCQDRKSGHVQYTAPYTHCGGGPGGWGCAIVEVPYMFFKTFGDPEPMKKYFPQMLRYFDYLEAHSRDDLVIDDQPGEWHLGEWCVPDSQNGKLPDIPEPFVNNYFYIRSINRVTEIARIIKKEEVIPYLEEVKARKVKALIREYYDDSTGIFAQNLNSANAFAVDLGLGDSRTLEYLAGSLEREGVFNTGIFGTDIALRILFENGYEDLAYRLLVNDKYPSYGHMMNKNATTLWEDWDTPRSMSHPMFGAPVRYLFNYILGIRMEEGNVGYKKVLISPADIAEIRKVSGTVTTFSGAVSVSIDKNKGEVTVSVPENMQAKFTYGGIKKELNKGTNTIKI